MADTGTPSTGEVVLVERARAGDRQAFGELYDRYAALTYRHIHCLVGDRQTTEDLTAQTFLQALQAIDRYEERGIPFQVWLLRIARNLAINHWRVRRNHSPGNNGSGLEQGNPTPSPESLCEAKLMEEEVWGAVRHLRGDQRQVIILRFVDGLSYPEVAQVLGKNIGAVRVIQYRALSALRRALEDGNLGHNSVSAGRLS
jgi:RNA polymerase sigma-70 factor (ECF subfamily)